MDLLKKLTVAVFTPVLGLWVVWKYFLFQHWLVSIIFPNAKDFVFPSGDGGLTVILAGLAELISVVIFVYLMDSKKAGQKEKQD